jgi:hypothetical protein
VREGYESEEESRGVREMGRVGEYESCQRNKREYQQLIRE